jgi:photosystem II stability/assembly factor-like uncharacterized protein
VPGWADDVVRAGSTAFVIGWNADETGALWQIDSAGRLVSRTPPPGMPGNAGLAARDRMFVLAFDSATTGLALTGIQGDDHRAGRATVYETHDGARSWSRVQLPTHQQPVQVATGGRAAYVLTADCGTPSSDCDHATLWSVDPTGATRPHTFDTLPGRASAGGPGGMAAYGSEVWVVLDAGGGRPTTVRSSDSGRTWRRFDAGVCIWNALEATSGNVAWGTCGTGMMEHFTRQAGSGAPVDVFSDELSGTSSSTLIPFTDTSAVAILDNRRAARVEATHDGGRHTYVVGAVPQPITRRGFEATFTSADIGYLVTLNGGRLYRTSDGGRHWQEVPRRIEVPQRQR